MTFSSLKLVKLQLTRQYVRKSSRLVSPLFKPHENLTSDELIKVPQFVVTPGKGYLPREHPLTRLPAEYLKLEELMVAMPWTRQDGQPGLLATGTFGETVDKLLPDYTNSIKLLEDTRLQTALFRDYSFAASAYLLEPCGIEYRNTKSYGFGRPVLPRKLAVPLCILADKIKAKPFMEYALSYALSNYALLDDTKPMDYENLYAIRQFDGSEAEKAFILVHVSMVRYSGALVSLTQEVLDAAEAKDRARYNNAMTTLADVSRVIVRTMNTMWNRSNSKQFDQFRTYIMGTKGQPMFPNGVIYEGVSDTPTEYRGSSGANDSMVPNLDNLLELTRNLPPNPLTEILRDFRTYRPADHNDWLDYVEQQAVAVQVQAFARQDPVSSVLYLACLDTIRDFRMHHWNLTKEYIIKQSEHPSGTGGSFIGTWLLNQLSVVLNLIDEVSEGVDRSQINDVAMLELFDQIVALAKTQKRQLTREVEKMKIKFG